LSKILFDIGHPADVHFYKNFIWEMEKKGHEAIITARRKESTFQLLEYYGFEFIDIGLNKKGLLNKAVGLAQTDYKIYKLSKKLKPDVLTGFASPYVTHVAKLIRKKSVLFNDTEHAALNNKLSIPFSDYFLTPSCFMKEYGKKHIKFNGYKELSYLHPKWFREEKNVLKELGIGKNEPFSLVRVVSWQASHDVGYAGISDTELSKLIKILGEHGKVLLSSESDNKKFQEYQINVHPAKMHTLMNYSSLYIGEGATMATETAVLGKPSIYISPLVGTMGNFIELEKYGLLFSYKNLKDSISTLQGILEVDSKKKWKEKREKLLQDKIDVTTFMINFFEENLLK